MEYDAYLQAMDPELRTAFLARVAVGTGTPAPATPTDAAACHGRVQVADRRVPGSADAPAVRVRLYTPVGGVGHRPALLWIHGGGFTAGTPEQNEDLCLRIAADLTCLVVSVDYRLAPAHPFPAATEDCYAALRWLAATAADLGVDPRRIAVGGSSAGGGLAAAVALMARDRGEVALAYQLLVYPCLDDRHETPSSHEFAAEGIIWNRAQSLRGWRAYLGADHQGDPSPYAAPARVADVAGLPPAYVMAAQLDLLRDEDIAYATRLMQAGVPTELHVHPGAMHGFVLFAAQAAASQRAIGDYVAALGRALNG